MKYLNELPKGNSVKVYFQSICTMQSSIYYLCLNYHKATDTVHILLTILWPGQTKHVWLVSSFSSALQFKMIFQISWLPFACCFHVVVKLQNCSYSTFVTWAGVQSLESLAWSMPVNMKTLMRSHQQRKMHLAAVCTHRACLLPLTNVFHLGVWNVF
jgi:hypothetical protein